MVFAYSSCLLVKYIASPFNPNDKAYHFDELTGHTTKIRDEYHTAESDTICITAGKTRLPEVYQNILSGKPLDKRGNIKI